MFGSGMVLVLLGLLAETPQGLVSLGFGGDLSPGTLPGTAMTRDMVLLGCVLCFCGLYRMAKAKRRSWGVALLSLVGVPGALAGVVIVFLLKSRNPVTVTRSWTST